MHSQHNHNLMNIDMLAQKSGLNYLNPGYKMFVAVLSLLICVVSESFIIIAIIAMCMAIAAIKFGGVKGSTYIHLLSLPSIFILMSGIAILIQISGKRIGLVSIPIGRIYLSITELSIKKTALVLLRAYGALSCLYMMSLSTPLEEMIHVLRVMKMPNIIIELMYLIYRYISILLEIHNKMTIAADSRLGYSSWRNTYQSMIGIASNLMVLSFRKASISFDAMESRGYQGRLVFWHEEKPLHKEEIGWAVSFYLIIFLVMILEKIVW